MNEYCEKLKKDDGFAYCIDPKSKCSHIDMTLSVTLKRIKNDECFLEYAGLGYRCKKFDINPKEAVIIARKKFQGQELTDRLQ